jgi:peptide/nickel transport system permease protein
MLQYIVRRILLFLPTLFFITLISFGISRLAPGDPAELKAGVGADGAMSGDNTISAKTIELIRKQWHLDKPVWQQYLIWMGLFPYETSTLTLAPADTLTLSDGRKVFLQEDNGTWNLQDVKGPVLSEWSIRSAEDDPTRFVAYTTELRGLLQGYLGTSFQDNRSVSRKIAERLPITLAMSILAVFIAYMVAIPLGIYSATHQGSTWDKISTITVFGLYSLPVFWIGTLGITFLCNPEYISIFPTGGIRAINHEADWSWFRKLGDYAYHLILPMIVYTYVDFAYISRQMRSGMLEVIRQDYVRTAKAKGLDNRTVIYKHALRNSLIPIITLLAGILPMLIGGSIVIETIFSIPGMGNLALQAMVARDYPTIMAVFTMSAVLTLLGILLADILYTVVDPRIAYAKKAS